MQSIDVVMQTDERDCCIISSDPSVLPLEKHSRIPVYPTTCTQLAYSTSVRWPIWAMILFIVFLYHTRSLGLRTRYFDKCQGSKSWGQLSRSGSYSPATCTMSIREGAWQSKNDHSFILRSLKRNGRRIDGRQKNDMRLLRMVFARAEGQASCEVQLGRTRVLAVVKSEVRGKRERDEESRREGEKEKEERGGRWRGRESGV